MAKKNDDGSIQVLKNDIHAIKEMMRELKDYFMLTNQENNRKFVTHDHLKAEIEKFKTEIKVEMEKLKPVKIIAYGMVGLILASFLSGLLNK